MRLWSWLYGLTLILIGVGLAVWAVVRVNEGPGAEGWLVFGFNLAAQMFIAIGAPVLGVERIRGRDIDRLKPVVRPDEWLVEKFGPKSKEPK